VREISRQHGAQITIEDVNPRLGAAGGAPGTRFTVRFPVRVG